MRKYRKKLKSDPYYHAKLQQLKEKKAENKAYKDKIKALRKSNPELDKKDMSWQSHDDILQKLHMPTLVPGRGLIFKFNVANILSKNKFVMK